MSNLKTVLTVLVSLIAWSVSAAQEYGIASVYSTKFQGNRTASGELFNHKSYTAAHRTLPFGTLIKITRTDNGKSVVVRINDRGPFVNEHVTDISKAAAAKLEFGGNEDIRVKIEQVNNPKIQIGSTGSLPKRDSPTPLLNTTSESRSTIDNSKTVPMPDPAEYVLSKSVEEPRTVPREYRIVPNKNDKNVVASNATIKKNPAPIVTSKSVTAKPIQRNGFISLKMNKPDASAGYAIQVASMSKHDNMMKKVDNLDNQFSNVFVSMVLGKNGDPDYKVMLGPFASHDAASNYLKTVKRKNIDGFVVNLKGNK